MKDEKLNIRIDPLSFAKIQKAANDFRELYWQEEFPVDIELIIERDLKLDMVPIPGLIKFTGTHAWLTGDLKEIDCDFDAPPFHVRFSLAHEVGHFILHAEQIEALRANTYTEWKETITDDLRLLWGLAEEQADCFARCVLIPKKSLEETIIKSFGDLINLATEKGVTNVVAINGYLAPLLSKLFFVPEHAMKIYLKEASIDPFKLMNEFNKQSKKGA